MTTITQLSSKVRGALAVSAEYEGSTIPDGIRRVMKRLLRDYNFPKSVRRFTTDAPQGGTIYTLPAGIKRPLEIRFNNPTDKTWSRRLERREGFTLPNGGDSEPGIDYADGAYGRNYWLEGANIIVDTPMPVAGLKFVLWYQTMLLDELNTEWLLDDMEDLIFTSSCVRLAAEFRKAEASAAFAPLLAEEMQSIAIYANELEWSGLQMQMREPRGLPSMRYPTGGAV